MPDHTRSTLRDALERLAADAETQQAYLRRLGTWPSLDELALELDDVALASESWMSQQLRDRVRALSRKLDEMSGEQNARHWKPEALYEADWVEVRQLAGEALLVFG